MRNKQTHIQYLASTNALKKCHEELSKVTLIIQINIIFILSYGYSYGYAINLVRTMYAANSKIVHGKEKTGRILGTCHTY